MVLRHPLGGTRGGSRLHHHCVADVDKPVTAEVSPSGEGGMRFGDPAGRWVLAATVLASALAFLDATVVNIALPAIGRDLGAGVSGLTWTVNAYTLALAAFVLVGGSLGDRFGRRRVFMVGVGWFGVTSLACALAPSIELLVAVRALQGAGAALLTPGALAILQSTFRAEDRSRAIGAWSGLAGLAGALGPFVGGWLVGVGSWRWVFVINVPLVVAVLLISARHLPRSGVSGQARRLDVGGALLAALGLGALTYALTAASQEGVGSSAVGTSAGLSAVAFVAFAVRERVAVQPMLPFELFTVARFSVTNVVTFLLYAGLGGVFFWVVVTLQVVAGWTPLAAGMALLPVTVLMLIFSPQAGALGERLGPRIPMTVGPLAAAAGVALLARIGPHAGFLGDVLPGMVLLGAGLTVTVTPLTATALGAVDDDMTGLASGVNNAVARTGGLVLVALLPDLTGLGGGGFTDPADLAPAFGPAMRICAALMALGGLVAAVALRAAPVARNRATCPPRHCALDATPPGVAQRPRPTSS